MARPATFEPLGGEERYLRLVVPLRLLEAVG